MNEENIKELKSKVILPYEPIKVAEMLIFTECEKSRTDGAILKPQRYKPSELREIAHYLMIYADNEDNRMYGIETE